MYKYILISKNIYLYIIFFSFVCTFFSLISSRKTFAQTSLKENVRVTPIIQDIHLVPGERYTYPLVIENLADKPLGIHLDLSGFDPSDTINAYSPVMTYSPLVSWTKVSETDVIIPPLGKKEIQIVIIAPLHIKESGYYESFIITPFISQQKFINQPIALTRFLSVVFATVGNLNYDNLIKKIFIVNFNPSHFFSFTKNVSISFTVKNNYFTHFSAKPILTVFPLFGMERSYLLDEKHIFPSTSRLWNIHISLPTNNIFYLARLTISVGNGKQIHAQTFFFSVPLYAFIFLILLCLIVLITILKKRLIHAGNILVTGKS
jgi:hypothetical protein